MIHVDDSYFNHCNVLVLNLILDISSPQVEQFPLTKCTLVDNMRFRHWFLLLGHLNIENKEDLTKSKALLTNPE